MLAVVGSPSTEALAAATVPAAIRFHGALDLPAAESEADLLAHLARLAGRNEIFRSYLGIGYNACFVPPVIQRQVLENPGWYTAYTPYQPEISQGRLEALLVFQTAVCELTGLPVANASLLDEATAAAEAMALAHRARPRGQGDLFLVAADCHPQTLAVMRTRALPTGIDLCVVPVEEMEVGEGVFGLLAQNPATDGRLRDLSPLMAKAREARAVGIIAADPLSLALVRPPGEMGAAVAVGSMQRFGVPLGYGGPHAAYMATEERLARKMPGRIVGVARDSAGRPALRLALQTREQHIRRDRATSNICTSQVLLAVMSGMYAVWHGPSGLVRIAGRVKGFADALAGHLADLGFAVCDHPRFDTVRVAASGKRDEIVTRALGFGINLRPWGEDDLVVALDETVGPADLADLVAAFGGTGPAGGPAGPVPLPPSLERTTPCLAHEVFSSVKSEHDMVRYLHRLESKDLCLTTSMIPLGSCTMKLNAVAQLMPISWPGFANIHPYAPAEQALGYKELLADLEGYLGEITGLPAVSLQPNAGSQGELAGLLAIAAWHRASGDGGRDICLIPASAHGTNPASAVMAGMRVVVVACDDRGNISLADLAAKAESHADRLAAIMVTFPSTHGVYEEGITDLARIVHDHGGQVYMDGANMTAQVGLCRPGDYGVDVCHLNLHKTFAIPHGGGGPGMGPIAVASHLAPYLPGPPRAQEGEAAAGPVSGAPWGSAGILAIPWMYIRLLGPDGLRASTEAAILNANYLAARLGDRFPVLYRGKGGTVAHEFVLDLRPDRKAAGITVADVAKRLMDYGFHAPTVSFPVPGTMMIEPTESEGKAELDRFADAMLAIGAEITEVADGRADPQDNLLRRAPHPAVEVVADDWDRPYSRERAAYPAPWTREAKFWPAVGRVDEVYGDRNFSCVCPPLEAYREE